MLTAVKVYVVISGGSNSNLSCVVKDAVKTGAGIDCEFLSSYGGQSFLCMLASRPVAETGQDLAGSFCSSLVLL